MDSGNIGRWALALWLSGIPQSVGVLGEYLWHPITGSYAFMETWVVAKIDISAVLSKAIVATQMMVSIIYAMEFIKERINDLTN